MSVSARTFGMPLRCSQNNGGVQMTAMNTARKKGTRMEPAAFIPATTMIKLARINSACAVAVHFTVPFIDDPFTPFDLAYLPQSVVFWLYRFGVTLPFFSSNIGLLIGRWKYTQTPSPDIPFSAERAY
jgi:hypothetical protein